MVDESTQEILKVLNKELGKQKGIFKKHAPIAINPTAKGYGEALTAFNKADAAIKSLEQQIAYLLTEDTYEPTIFDKIKDIADKLTGDDDPGTSSTTGVRG